MRQVSAQALIDWGGAELRLDPSGVARLERNGELVVELCLTDARGAGAEFETEDEVEHSLALPNAHAYQRHSAIETWRSRWVIEATSDIEAEQLSLSLRPGPEYSLWAWASGVTALLVVAPAHAAGPVLLFRVEQGFLEPVRTRLGAAGYQLLPDSSALPAGQRLVTSLVADWYPGLGEVAGRLPPWLKPVWIEADDPWLASVADFGVTAGTQVRVELLEDQVSFAAAPGRHLVDVQLPRGLSRIALEWVPRMDSVLAGLAGQVLNSSGELGVADGLCLQFAADAGLVWLDRTAHDRLDSLDWRRDGSVLGAAFALARGRSLGEAALVSDGLRQLGQLPVGEGYARVAMAGWIASVTVGLEARERCLRLLGRRAIGRTAALESSLLHYRSPDAATAELAGVMNRLGGDLPGDPALLSWVERARLAGLLELTPAEWEQGVAARETAAKAAAQVLTGYADGRIKEASPLVWLLLNRRLGLLG